MINEPIPFSKKWYSHKFKGAGLRYEVGVSINTGYIVWFNGPYPCGLMSDSKIFCRNLKWLVDPCERVIADKGYQGITQIYTPYNAKSIEHREAMGLARARHETVNRRLKQWQCLQQRYRHDRNKHGMVFGAVACLTQMEIVYGNPVFQINYESRIITDNIE